jgi:aminomethyltransferase
MLAAPLVAYGGRMGSRTPLYDTHVSFGAKMVEFSGWDMPLSYGSQIEEHHAVRKGAGLFDVSHMCIADLAGERCKPFLRRLLANDVERLHEAGQALYSCMLNEAGGVLDDLIVYFFAPDRYRIVSNAGTRAKDLAWMRAQAASFGVSVTERADLAMLAVQGPQARERCIGLLAAPERERAEALPSFAAESVGDWLLARTGYTGEDGFEIMLPAAAAVPTWRALVAAGVRPAGLGARDTLRLEAGLNLYGNDMDESTHPLESGLGWTVAFEPADRDFVGRQALAAWRGQPMRRLVGLVLEDRGVLRSHQKVRCCAGEGITTSGGFAPTLNRSIALARVPADCGEHVQVEIRDKSLNARVVKPPFVRHGVARISI